MKRRIFSTFLLMLLVVAAFAKPYKVTASKLNVRSTPDASGAVVGSLTQNAEVDVTRISGGWAEITFKGKKAYISAQYITPVSGSRSSASSSSSSSKSSGGNMPPQNPRKNKNNTASNNSGKSSSSSGGHMPPQNPRKNKNNTASANSGKGGGAKVAHENSIEDPMISGFVATYDLRWAMASGSYQKNKTGGYQAMNMGADKKMINGLTTGFGFEYNAIVHRTNTANIMVGGRTGFSYDYFASGSFTSGSKETGDYMKGRCSYHSFTFPLQPQLSFEWVAGGINMGFGLFTGPVFEAYFMRNLWLMETGTSMNMCVKNYVTGHILGIGGSQTIPDEERGGKFNCMWDTGIFFQLGKFRFFFSTAWGIHNFMWTKGGGPNNVPAWNAHVNRPVAFGFQTLLTGKKKSK